MPKSKRRFRAPVPSAPPSLLPADIRIMGVGMSCLCSLLESDYEGIDAETTEMVRQLDPVLIVNVAHKIEQCILFLKNVSRETSSEEGE